MLPSALQWSFTLLSESRGTPPHNLALTHQLRVELTPVERQIDVKIHPIERPLRRVHPLEILLEILSR